MSPNHWISSNDTGVSSKTIWAVMMNCVNTEDAGAFDYDIPHDPEDFGRCYRLLEAVPEWKPRLFEVARAFPKWGPLVREWNHLSALYASEYRRGECHELWEAMRALDDECMTAGGWVKTSPCSWEKKH
jgi:hypothetical protein